MGVWIAWLVSSVDGWMDGWMDASDEVVACMLVHVLLTLAGIYVHSYGMLITGVAIIDGYEQYLAFF